MSYKQKIKKIIKTLLICIFMVFIGFSLNSDSSSATTRKFKVINQKDEKTFYIDSDVVFEEIFSSHSWFFNIDKWWNTEYVEAKIDFSINQLVQKSEESYIVFSVNDTPFLSKKIFYNPKEETQTISVKIPNKLIKKESNKFTINAYKRITGLPCVDDVNPANWLDIYKTSKVVVHYKELLSPNYISDFPYPFLKVNDDKYPKNAIVVSDKASNNEIALAFMLNSYLGMEYKNGDYNGKIIKMSDINKYNDYNLIFIGNQNGTPKEIKGKLKGVPQGNFDDGAVIKIIDSPYTKKENTKVLAIISNNNELLEKAIRFIMNDSLVSQVNQDQYIIDKSTSELQEVKEPYDQSSLNNLGYNDIVLKGPFRQTANIQYYIPKSRSLSEGGEIKLNMRYAENLDFNKALVTIYINDVPIGSKKLTKENANGDTCELDIPLDIKQSGYLNIQVAFDLETKDYWCQRREEQTPWALVTNDSYIYVPSSKETNYYFNKYPNPFISNGEINNTLIITPDNIGSDDLTALGNIVAYWGKDLKYNTGTLIVENGSNVNGSKNYNNLIVYGTPNSNPFIKSINNNLWFKYSLNYNNFESNEKLYLTNPFSSEIATYQLDISPFNEQMVMLVVTSPNKDILIDSTRYLSSSKKITELNGDSQVIDKYGNIISFKMKSPNEKPKFKTIKSTDATVKVLLIILIVITLLILFIIFMFIKKYKKIDKNSREDKNFEDKLKKLIKKK